jgi:hypothetical protein
MNNEQNAQPTSESLPIGNANVVGSALTESQIEHQIEMDEEEDSYWMDEDDDEIWGYECMGCGNVQANQSGFGCDVCSGHCLEPLFG